MRKAFLFLAMLLLTASPARADIFGSSGGGDVSINTTAVSSPNFTNSSTVTWTNNSGTITATASAPNTSGWTDGGTNVYVTANTDNVGVGTASLTTNAKLTIKGNGSTTGAILQTKDSANAAKVTILDNGNVGVGTSVPATNFQLRQSANGVNALSIKRFTDTGPVGYLLQLNRADNTVGAAWGTDGQLSVGNSFVEFWQSYMPVSGWALDSANGNNLLIGSEDGKQIYIYPQGAGKLFVKDLIANSGNVGIGTSAPTAALSVYGTATGTANAFRVSDSSGAVGLTVLDNGNVGIGTSTPAGKLVVYGGNVGIGTTAPGGKLIVMDGNVGIGSTVPLQMLHLFAGNLQLSDTSPTFTSTTAGTLQLGGGRGTPHAGAIVFGDGSGWKMHIGLASDNADTKFVTVKDDGNVGIGTSIPSGTLDVLGNARVWSGSGSNDNANGIGELYVQGDLEVDGQLFGDGSQLTGIAAGGWTDGGTNIYSVVGDNVGIGTSALTSTAKLTVQGNGAGTDILAQFRNSSAAAKVTVLDNGNVGLGSTLPSVVLDVNGTGRFAALETTGTGIGTVTAGAGIDFKPDNTTVKASMNASGYIGIGTSAPTGALDVRGNEVNVWTGAGTNTNATSSGELYVEGDLEVDGTVYMASCSGDGCGGVGGGGWTDGGTNVYVSTAADNVGIGTGTLVGKLTIMGNGTTTGINTQFLDSAAAAKITILDNGNIGLGSTVPQAKLVIAGDGTTGNVGIGTSTPSGRLVVFGGNMGVGSTAPVDTLDVVDSCIVLHSPDGSLSSCCVANDDTFSCTGL